MRQKRFSHKFNLGALSVAMLFFSVSVGCAPSMQPQRPVNWSSPSTDELSKTENTLRTAIAPWLGTPYQFGGTTRRGIDCSALVQQLYEDVFGRSLPRTTEKQIKVGWIVDRDELHPGDLIFFKRATGRRHVGIYLGHNEFAHASGARGVVISNLYSEYWRAVYWMARRII